MSIHTLRQSFREGKWKIQDLEDGTFVVPFASVMTNNPFVGTFRPVGSDTSLFRDPAVEAEILFQNISPVEKRLESLVSFLNDLGLGGRMHIVFRIEPHGLMAQAIVPSESEDFNEEMSNFMHTCDSLSFLFEYVNEGNEWTREMVVLVLEQPAGLA